MDTGARWLAAIGSLLMAGCLLVAIGTLAFAQTTTVIGDLSWDYDDAQLTTGPVALFLVCVDGQPTAACAQVPISTGLAGPTAGVKTYSWRLPPLLAGPHTVAVQACTAAAATCSSGVSLNFTFAVIANPKNLRLGK